VQMSGIPFGVTDWSKAERTEHKGETGMAHWRTLTFGGIRVRMVEYTPGYLADHWCSKGHILLCLEGELHTSWRMAARSSLRPASVTRCGQRRVPSLFYPHRGEAVHRGLNGKPSCGAKPGLRTRLDTAGGAGARQHRSPSPTSPRVPYYDFHLDVQL